MELPVERVDNVPVNGRSHTADSLILSVLSGVVCAAAFLLGYTGVSPWWGALVMWLACPALVLFSSGCIVSDLLKQDTRKQGFVAAALLIPTAAVVWHFRFMGLSSLPH